MIINLIHLIWRRWRGIELQRVRDPREEQVGTVLGMLEKCFHKKIDYSSKLKDFFDLLTLVFCDEKVNKYLKLVTKLLTSCFNVRSVRWLTFLNLF